MAFNHSSSKLFIPHPTENNCSIVGILEQLCPGCPTQGRKIALILHGTMGHKDYLFQRRLAACLPFDSFRFDFRGNHETPGTWRQGCFKEDVEDLSAVVGYLQREYGYVIDLIVGHSRGSLVGLRWICTSEEGQKVTGFVNVSGRYRMHKILDSAAAKRWQEAFETDGYYDWATTVARKPRTARIYPEDLDMFVKWDTSFVWDQFPSAVNVLTLQGLADQTVPPYDGLIYARALSTRSPGTHTLHLVEDADHNFTGRYEEVINTILEWWEALQRDSLKSSGVWMTGVRGKL